MKLSLLGLLRLRPFNESDDPPKPAWMDSWWFGGMLFAGALCGALGAISLVAVNGRHLIPLFATAAALFSLASAVELFADLKARALNTLFIAGLCAVTITAFALNAH